MSQELLLPWLVKTPEMTSDIIWRERLVLVGYIKYISIGQGNYPRSMLCDVINPLQYPQIVPPPPPSPEDTKIHEQLVYPLHE